MSHSFTLRNIVLGPLCVFLLVGFSAFPSQAQNPQLKLATQFGTASADAASAVKVHDSGDIFVAGHTTGTMGASSHGSQDGFIRRMDSTGTISWTTQFGTADSDSIAQLTFDETSLYSVGSRFGGGFDAHLARLDLNGNLLWEQSFGTSSNDVGEGVAGDGAGNVFVAGYTAGALEGTFAGGSFDAWVTKFDASGNQLWSQQFGTGNTDQAFAVDSDATGNAYVTGRTEGFLNGDSGFTQDAFVSKIDAMGNIVWQHQFGGPGTDIGRDIVFDDNGNILVAGSVNNGNGVFLRKYDTDGNLAWEKLTTGTFISVASVQLNAAGEIFVGGHTSGDFAAPNAGNLDAFGLKFDANGEEVWRVQFGSMEPDWNWDIAASGNDIYFAGQTREAVFGQTSLGSDDAYLLRFVAIPEPDSLTLIGLVICQMFGRRRKP